MIPLNTMCSALALNTALFFASDCHGCCKHLVCEVSVAKWNSHNVSQGHSEARNEGLDRNITKPPYINPVIDGTTLPLPT